MVEEFMDQVTVLNHRFDEPPGVDRILLRPGDNTVGERLERFGLGLRRLDLLEVQQRTQEVRQHRAPVGGRARKFPFIFPVTHY
jgi:hypothetical protein